MSVGEARITRVDLIVSTVPRRGGHALAGCRYRERDGLSGRIR
jgi:hypothetical protein